MTDKDKIIQEIERRIHFLEGMINTDFGRGSIDALNNVLDFINSLPAEQPNLKVEFAGKEYEVVRVRELFNGTTMYGILDEPNHIDYINKDNCEIVSEQLSDDLNKEIEIWQEYFFKNNPISKEILKNAAIHFANWQKERIINKACEWLNKNVVEYHPRKGELRPIVNINAFREAMVKEGE